LVRGTQLEFQIETRFPIMSLFINGLDKNVLTNHQAWHIFSTPMQMDENNHFNISELTITVELVKGQDREKKEVAWELITKQLPGALWNPYDGRKSMLDQPNTQQHLMGVKMKAIPATESQEKLPAINMEKFNCEPIGGFEHKFPEVDIPATDKKAETPPQMSLADMQRVLDQWETLRKQYTGGGATIR
jgi:hypothetical protein